MLSIDEGKPCSSHDRISAEERQEAFFSASEESAPSPSPRSPRRSEDAEKVESAQEKQRAELAMDLLTLLENTTRCLADGEYRAGKFIAKGTFSKVYEGVHVPTGSRVAIKLERISKRRPQLLMREARLCKKLARVDTRTGLPNVRWFGVVGAMGTHNAMVMDRLGPSLEDLFLFSNKSFSVETICNLMLQALDRIQALHEQRFVHRDIQPANFLVGNGPANTQVNLIDLGLAKRYQRGKTHIPFRESKVVLGKNPFGSVNARKHNEQSRRDDLESLGYVMIYFQIGWLPWLLPRDQATAQTAPEAVPEGMRRSRRRKLETEVMCLNCCPQFATWLKYSMGLRFEERPNYGYLRELLREAAASAKEGSPRAQSLDADTTTYNFNIDWRISPTAWSQGARAKTRKKDA